MNDREHELSHEERESNSYSTGIKYAKRRSTLTLVLVGTLIFFGGIITALGLVNIRLLGWAEDQDDASPSLAFYSDENASVAIGEPVMEAVEPTQPQQEYVPITTTPQALENIPLEGGLSLQEVYTKTIDSVVSISCNTGTGTGVILSAEGYIVTNCHVVEGAYTVDVLLNDGTIYGAQLVGKDSVSDLAVLWIEAENLVPAQFGDSDSLRVGDAVVAIGDPLGIGLRGTMTDGIISAINRDITTDGRTMNLIQTNAALNSGNSGGPLINCYGQVIGINTMKIGDYMNADGVEGLGFAIPSSTVKEIVEQLIRQGYVSGRPTLGIVGQALSSFDIMYYRLPQGIYITAVDQQSDAASKGISPGDILLQFDDTRILSGDDLKQALSSRQAGDTVELIIYRSGVQYAVQVILDEATNG